MQSSISNRQLVAALLGVGTMFALSGPVAADTFTVTNTSDNDGTTCSTNPFIGCSLRQAIAAANATSATDHIVFNIVCGTRNINVLGPTLRVRTRMVIDGNTQPTCGEPVPGDRTSRIELRGRGSSVFPNGLVVHGLVLDAGSGGSQIRGLAINGFSGSAIGIVSSGNVIGDNKLGTDPTGNLPRANGQGVGIGDTSNNNDLFDNVISGNGGHGVNILGDSNQLYGNLIGTTIDGATELRNGGDGVSTFGANFNEIGIAPGGSLTNVIAFNAGTGVRIGLGTGNAIVGNRITGNDGLGIVLNGTGANQGQVAPVLQSAVRTFQYFPGPPPRIVARTIINGTLSGASSGGFLVDLYGNDSCDPSGSGEGQAYLGTATVNTNGTFSLTTSAGAGAFVTALARSPQQNSSQFSNCATVL